MCPTMTPGASLACIEGVLATELGWAASCSCVEHNSQHMGKQRECQMRIISMCVYYSLVVSAISIRCKKRKAAAGLVIGTGGYQAGLGRGALEMCIARRGAEAPLSRC